MLRRCPFRAFPKLVCSTGLQGPGLRRRPGVRLEPDGNVVRFSPHSGWTSDPSDLALQALSERRKVVDSFHTNGQSIDLCHISLLPKVF